MIELSRTQEQTKAAEAAAKTAEMQALAAQHATNTEKVRHEEIRKTDQARAQQSAELKQYEDELARKRRGNLCPFFTHVFALKTQGSRLDLR